MQNMIMDRYDAREQGLTHYFNNKPCKRGHIAKRFTASGNCTQCHKERHQLRGSNVWFTFRFQARSGWHAAAPFDEMYAHMQAEFIKFCNSKGFY